MSLYGIVSEGEGKFSYVIQKRIVEVKFHGHNIEGKTVRVDYYVIRLSLDEESHSLEPVACSWLCGEDVKDNDEPSFKEVLRECGMDDVFGIGYAGNREWENSSYESDHISGGATMAVKMVGNQRHYLVRNSPTGSGFYFAVFGESGNILFSSDEMITYRDKWDASSGRVMLFSGLSSEDNQGGLCVPTLLTVLDYHSNEEKRFRINTRKMMNLAKREVGSLRGRIF